MGLRDFVSNLRMIASTDMAKVQDKVSADRLIKGGKSEDWGWQFGKEDMVRPKLMELEFYITKDPIVFNGLNLFAQAIIGNGFVLKSENKKALELCEEVVAMNSFNVMLQEMALHALGYGDGYSQMKWNQKHNRYKKFFTINPTTMFPKWDAKGEIKYWQQEILDQKQEKKFYPEDIAHFYFWSIGGDSVRHIGLVEPLIHILWIKRNIEMSTGEAFWKFSNPPIHVTRRRASPKQIRNLYKKFKNFTRKSIMATSDDVEVKTPINKSSFPDFSYAIDMIFDELAAGLRTPKAILISAADTLNRATLQEVMKEREKEITYLQNKLGKILEEQIFQPLMKANDLNDVPEVIWKPVSFYKEKEKAEAQRMRIDSINIMLQSQIISETEAREMLKDILMDYYGKKLESPPPSVNNDVKSFARHSAKIINELGKIKKVEDE